MNNRPKEKDEQIVTKAIDMLFPSVWDWVTTTSGQSNYPNEEREHLKTELESVLKNAWEKDGYQLAKALDNRFMWECDSSLVDILDSYENFLSKVHREAVKQWVIDNNIIPQKKIGDAVEFTALGGIFKGTILSVNAETAQYTINVPEMGHLEYVFNNGVATRVKEGISGTIGTIKSVEDIDD